MTKMNYQQAIEFLYSRLPMFSRTGAAAYKPDLANTITLCEYFNDPHLQFKSIHIAGTNGKGSVSHMLASVLQTAGYKTGLYTSPHLKDFRERIKINGNMIPEDFVVSFTESVQEKIEEIDPSFFEVTVVMAFAWFAENNVDIAVIETGLGGRLDSTNVITPVLSVITNIGFDHMNILGDSIEQIAMEKAGIIKPGIPVVIGETRSETLPIFKKTAMENDASLFVASKIRQVMDWYWKKHELIVEVAEQHHIDHKKFHLDLPGVYQKKNLLTVLEVCSQLQQQGWNLRENDIREGIRNAKKNTGLHGRWEIIHHNPLVILDVAHNEDGMRELLHQVEVMVHRQLHIIIGMAKDKEVEKVLELLPVNAQYYFTKASIPRAMPEEKLMETAGKSRLKGRPFPDVNKALEAALEHAHAGDLILVCGSVYLVGEVSVKLD